MEISDFESFTISKSNVSQRDESSETKLSSVWLSLVFMLWWRQFGATGDTVMVMIQFFPALNGYK